MKLIGATILAGGPGSGCHGDNCGRPPKGGNVEEGDHAVLQKPLHGWDERNFKKRIFPVGTRVRVIGVTKELPGVPATAMVLLPQRGGTEKVPVADLFVVKKAKQPKIIPSEAPKSKIKTRFKTADGADVTILKPSGEPHEKDRATGPHHMKGKFQELTGKVKVIGEPGATTRLFWAKQTDAPDVLPNVEHRTLEQNPEAWKGTTLFVHEYERAPGTRQPRMVIREASGGQFGHTSGVLRQYAFRNGGAGRNFLKRRYGVALK